MNPAVCRVWQQLTGDAGWGGVLSESAADNSKSIVTIVFRPGLDPLPLLAESLALLPPDVRRDVAFSTYYTKLPPGVECHWRCVLEGSPESKATTGPIINLCRPLPPAQGARWSLRHARALCRERSRRLSGQLMPNVRTTSNSSICCNLPIGRLRGGSLPTAAAANALEALEPLPPQLPDDVSFSSAESTDIPQQKPRLRRSSHWPIVAAIGAIVLILAGGSTAYWLASRNAIDTSQGSEKAPPPADEPKSS